MKQSTLILLFVFCVSFVVAQNCKDRGANTCPSSECCSQYGWCGTTADHCSPSNNCAYNCWSPSTNSKIFVGYIPSWMTYYPSPCNLNLNNLNVGRFTHLNIPFAEFSSANNFALYPQAGEITNWYNQVIALKSKNTKLKVLISVGGGAFGPTAWATMASTATNRQNFVNSAISFARARNFDGIDIDWEFPTSSSQTPQIVSLFSVLRSSINAEAASSNRPALLLTIAAPNYQQAINLFNFPVIHQYLDWINVMTYDYAGDWSSAIGANTAFNGVTGTLSYFTSIGVPANKLVMGFANYARTFTLRSAAQNTPGSPFNGKGVKGSCTNAAGSYNYNEVANFISSNPSGTYRYDSASNTPYFFSGLQWVTYDNPQSLQLKVNYLNNQNLRGAMVWALDGNYTLTNFVAGAIGL